MGIFKPRYDIENWVFLEGKEDLIAGEIVRSRIIRGRGKRRRDLFFHRHYDVRTYAVEKINGSPNFKFVCPKEAGAIYNVPEKLLSRILPVVI